MANQYNYQSDNEKNRLDPNQVRDLTAAILVRIANQDPEINRDLQDRAIKADDPKNQGFIRPKPCIWKIENDQDKHLNGEDRDYVMNTPEERREASEAIEKAAKVVEVNPDFVAAVSAQLESGVDIVESPGGDALIISLTKETLGALTETVENVFEQEVKSDLSPHDPSKGPKFTPPE